MGGADGRDMYNACTLGDKLHPLYEIYTTTLYTCMYTRAILDRKLIAPQRLLEAPGMT